MGRVQGPLHLGSKFRFQGVRNKLVLCAFKEAPVLCWEIRVQDNRERLPERADAELVAVWIIRVQPWKRKQRREHKKRLAWHLLLGIMVPCRGKALKRVTSCIDWCVLGIKSYLILIWITLQCWFRGMALVSRQLLYFSSLVSFFFNCCCLGPLYCLFACNNWRQAGERNPGL